MNRDDHSRPGGSTRAAAKGVEHMQSNHPKDTGESGPLRSEVVVRDAELRGSNAAAARWLAYVGLGGRYAVRQVQGTRRDGSHFYRDEWVQWTGRGWRPVQTHVVRSAARSTLWGHYDRCVDGGAPADEVIALMRCIDVEWAWALVREMQKFARLDAAEANA